MSDNFFASDSGKASSEDSGSQGGGDDDDELVISRGSFKLKMEDPTPIEMALLGLIAALIFAAVVAAGKIVDLVVGALVVLL